MTFRFNEIIQKLEEYSEDDWRRGQNDSMYPIDDLRHKPGLYASELYAIFRHPAAKEHVLSYKPASKPPYSYKTNMINLVKDCQKLIEDYEKE